MAGGSLTSPSRRSINLPFYFHTCLHVYILHVKTSTIHPSPPAPLTDLTKNTAASYPRFYMYNNHSPHACHRQANVEHIKRVSCNDCQYICTAYIYRIHSSVTVTFLCRISVSSGDGDCSDSVSSQEDSCSTSSSAQRDVNRHCDCCYCEVFGHGVVSYILLNFHIFNRLSNQMTNKCVS